MLNKTTRLTLLVTIIGWLFSPLSILSGEIHSEAGTSAFPFLKINIGARPIAMGGAATGLADDEAALYYNPAGITGFKEKRWIGGYHNYFLDMQSGFFGMIFPLDEQSSIAGHLDYLGYGEFVETDTSGRLLGTFGGADMVLAATYSRLIGYNLSLGVTAKYIYERVQEFSASGIAVDLGARYSDDRERFTGGVMVQNLGKQLSSLGEEKYRLPLTFRGGVSYRPVGLPLLLATDLILPVDNDFDFAIGGEYHELKPLYLRLGWNSFGSNYRAGNSDDKWAGLSVGCGFDYKRLHFAYAFAPGADLGDSHRITVTGGFPR
ncbi:MAG: PorV/PorQ family protein [candidate division Zixibacteria bacterium]|nr:PorV/PorQ family protein [candidate division Zixibacteria bacterium]MDH3937442.1 PorV/PorQ family protein [candidate division Zixibacteria bacterium]MDH4034772.1 PorV/PorQ family protein [candidate division Zixibacteria bacterium]